MKNLAVFFGGKSVEHDISIITALQTMKHIPSEYNILPIYIKPNGEMITSESLMSARTYLDFEKKVVKPKQVVFLGKNREVAVMKKGKIKFWRKLDCALLCTHGYGGEDGCLQGLLEMNDIPFTSCSVASSALCMDKALTKIILKDANILSLPYVQINKCEYKENPALSLKNVEEKINYPCIVKPANLGSSVGISICEDEQTLQKAVELALKYDDKIIIEKYLSNVKEFACAVIKTQNKLFSSEVLLVQKGKMFSFKDKYLSQRAVKTEKIQGKITEKIKKLAEKSYKALDCDGVVRVDFLLDEESNKLYVNEINSIPGSLSFNMFNIPFKDLITSLIESAIEKNIEKNKINYVYNSNAIEKYVELDGMIKNKS